MDYLKTLGSVAVSTLVQKSGLNLPFVIGQKVFPLDGVCTLYDGTKRDDGSPVSVFEYDFGDSTKKSFKPFAQNALRKLRATRHPDILKFFDVVETDSTLHIMTERVKPLQPTLSSWSSRTVQEREDWLLWGLHRISVAVAFLNDACTSTHGRVCINSIFITPSGEWKLGGFELLSSPKDEAIILYTMGSLYPGSSAYAPPEVKSQGWTAIKDSSPAAPDGYALGVLLQTVFNPTDPPLATLSPPHQPPSAASRGAIPSALFNPFKRLLHPNPKNRLTPKQFLEIGMSDSGFFQSNRLVQLCLGLDTFAISNEAEKLAFLRIVKDSAPSLPPEFASYRVLPSLLSALEYGGAMAATILPLVLQFSTNISSEESNQMIIGPLVKLYSNPDRGTRMALLDHLSEYVDKLDKKTVSDKIWPHLQTGFSDTVAVVREATTKSIIQFAPKLSDRLLNNDLLRLLAKMQVDPEASIRTNACILIGRLGPSLGYNTKRKVLVPAFTRSLKDSFVHARVAGLMAFMATIDCFEIEDIASKVIPNVSPSLLDKEKLVRDQAFKAIDLFVKRLESHAEKMPEAALVEAGDGPLGSLPASASLVNTAAGAAGALAGWAITSLGKRLAASDLQSTITPQAEVILERPNSTPVSDSGILASSFASIPGTYQPENQEMKVKGMQLGVKQVKVDFGEFDQGVVGDLNGPLINHDLIDMNTNDDDWGAFEASPSIIQPKPARSQSGTNLLSSPSTSWSTTQHTTTGSRQKPTSAAKVAAPNSGPPSRFPTPVSSSQKNKSEWVENLGWDNSPPTNSPPGPTVIYGGSSKEDKATELARRREERKQRIAQLKEQKRNATRP